MKKSAEQQAKEILENWLTDEVYRALETSAKETGKKAAAEVKKAAPKDTGEYKRTIKSKTDKRGARPKVTVYSDKKPGLTHLLEHGHAKAGGGKTKAYPHWKEGQDYIEDNFAERFLKELDKK